MSEKKNTTGNAILYFPESHELSNITYTALRKNDDFDCLIFHAGQVGVIDYDQGGKWKGIIVRLFQGTISVCIYTYSA